MFSHRFTVPGRKTLPTVSCLAFTGLGINALIDAIASTDLWLGVTGACCFLLATGSILLSTRKHLGEIQWNTDRVKFTIDDREILSCDHTDILNTSERGGTLRIRTRGRWRRIAIPRAGMPPELKQILTKQPPPPAANPPAAAVESTPAETS